MWLSLLAALAVSAPFAIADIQFLTPKPGDTISGGTSGIQISTAWQDSGNAPSISDLTTYQLFLCAGGNTEGSYDQLATITSQGTFTAGNQALGSIALTVGASIDNAYFLKIISTASTGGTVTNFSPRFSLSGLTGSFPAPISSALTFLTPSVTTSPPTINNVAAAPAAPAAPADPNNPTPPASDPRWLIPFAQQTGATRYAPMPMVPMASITRKGGAFPQFPTSAYTVATTFMAPPSVYTTVTQPQTNSVTSWQNKAPPASAPTPDAMRRWLERWKD